MRKWGVGIKKSIEKILLSDDCSNISFGSSAIFIPIDASMGAKVFVDERNRDFSYSLQKLAFSKDIGPEVGDKFQFNFFVVNCDPGWKGLRDAGKRPLYGYLTQNTPTIDDTGEKYSKKQMEFLISKMGELGMSDYDVIDRNLAIVEDRLICVDFDLCSQRKEDGS